MQAVWRWGVIILGGAVALTLMGAGLLVYLVHRIDLKPEIERVVENATGRNLTISGEVGVSFWPVIGVRAHEVALANAPGGRAAHFLTAAELDIGVEIMPLIARRIEVRRLVLQRPAIAFEVDEAGAPNWVFASQTQQPTPPTPPAPGEQPPPQSPGPSPSLREIRIVDGEASFFDARRATGWSVGAVNLTTAITHMDEPMRLEGRVRYNDADLDIEAELMRPGAVTRGELTPLKVNLRGELLAADFDGRTIASSGELAGIVRASGPSLRRLAAWHGAPIPGEAGFADFAITGRVAMGDGVIAFTNAAFSVDRVQGRGDFTLSNLEEKPYLSGRIELMDFDLNPYLLGAPPGPSPESAAAAGADAPSAAIAAVEAPQRAVDVRAAQLSTAAIDFSGLHAINGDLEIITQAVLVEHMRIDRARANIVINDGFLAGTVQEVRLYRGTGRGRFEIDARRADVRIVQDFAFENLDTQRFLTDAVNYAGLEGRSELSIHVRAVGRSVDELVASADGRIHLEIISGVLHGVDLGGVSSTIRNALRGELIAPQARTPFLGFSGTFAVYNGVLASNNLRFNTENLRILGLGVIDTSRRRLDMRLSPRAPQGGATFPFSVRGPWWELTYAADLNGRVERELGARVESIQEASRTAPAQ